MLSHNCTQSLICSEARRPESENPLKMRVLQVGPFPPPNGGVQTNLKAIFDRLISLGNQSFVAAITRDSRTEGAQNVFKPRSAVALLWLLIRLKFNVVHLHIGGSLSRRLTTLLFICGYLPFKKSVVTFHSGGFAANEGRGASRASFRGLAFRSVDHVIGVNPQMIDMFAAFGVKKSRTSLISPFSIEPPPSDIDLPDDIRAFLRTQHPALVTVGLLEAEYALPTQIDALRTVLQTHPDAGLLILGGGSLMEELSLLVDSKPYRRNIMLAGDLDHARTLKVIETSNALLRTTDHDGDSVAIREALFLNTPVIATDNGMRPPGVRLIPLPADPDVLAINILESLARPEYEMAMPESGGSKNIDAVLAIYERLCR